MTLYDIERSIEKKIGSKRCRIHGDPKFRYVRRVLVHGPPSGWGWSANLEFENRTESRIFQRIKDVEVEEAKI
jgi:hypothetical protein